MAKEKEEKFTDWLLREHLWIFVIWVVPVSVIWDLLCYLGTRINYALGKSDLKHGERVADVQRQVRKWRENGAEKFMCTSRPAWKSISLQPMNYKSRMHGIKIDLPDVLSIDTEARMVRVEPMVTIGQLNDFLISRGWTLPVVPELDDLTIGGLVMGGGIESTSHKYGLFQYICKKYEMVLADGSLITCSKDEEPELYSAIPFSYGTIGFLTAIDIDIIPYKPYIKMNYVPVYSLDDVVNEFTRVTNDPSIDSVEGIMYNLNEGVIMSGVFVDECPEQEKLNNLELYYKPWFYKHVEGYLKKKKSGVEYHTTLGFFHRQNKAFFWLMPYIIPFANNVVFRYLFGWTMPPKFSLLKWIRTTLAPEDQRKNFVCQDFGYNLTELKEGLQFVHKENEIYPLWLCPTRHVVPKELQHLSLFRPEDVHVDVGIYGYSPIKNFDLVASQKRMERYAIDRNSYVALYAETQLTRDDFLEMFEFNLRNYDKVRAKYDCEDAFPHIYDKISKAARG